MTRGVKDVINISNTTVSFGGGLISCSAKKKENESSGEAPLGMLIRSMPRLSSTNTHREPSRTQCSATLTDELTVAGRVYEASVGARLGLRKYDESCVDQSIHAYSGSSIMPTTISIPTYSPAQNGQCNCQPLEQLT